jgi:hypothetical protein
MAAAWLQGDCLSATCRSDLSDALPQKPERFKAHRPTSVPPLDLTGLAGCADDSDGEGVIIGVEDSGNCSEEALSPSPTKATGDTCVQAPEPLADHCGGSGHGGSSTASTRAASTPSAPTAGGPLSPCPQVAPSQSSMAKTSKAP